MKLVRSFGKLALAAAFGIALAGCVYEPAPYASAYPAYGYAYAPAPAYYGPNVVVGVGHWRHWR